MKNKLFLGLMLFFGFKMATAQEVISSAGGVYSNSQGSFSVTVGELTNATLSNSSIGVILTQGFQQTYTAIVPLKLVEFSGTRIGKENKLNWKVVNEKDIESYIVQRSYDGMSFSEVEIVAASNNGLLENKYSIIDDNAVDQNIYYRILIKDKNARDSYSWVINLTINKSENIKLYPNPVKSDLTIQYVSTENTLVKVNLFDLSGKLVLTKNLAIVSGTNTFSIEMNNLPSGSYYLNGIGSSSIKIIKE